LIQIICVMESLAQQKAWIAKIAGSCYFILIGFAYAVMELVSGHFDIADFGVLVWSCLPILINKRWMYLCFGGLNLMIWSYIAVAMLVKGLSDVVPLLVISLVTLGAIVSALLLIYSAVNISEKRFSLI
jgi:hypothetical protein